MLESLQDVENSVKRMLENSCMKGCVVYLLALIVVAMLSASGLSGLGARFGLGGQSGTKAKPGAAAQTAPQEQANVAQQAPTTGPSGQGPEGTPTGSGTSDSKQKGQDAAVPPPVQAAPQVAKSAPPPASGSSSPQTQAQGGVITGQTTAPFYVVQEGDTLWGLASKFGVSIDSLKALNKIDSEIIRPGQVLYLPQDGQSQGQPPVPAPVEPSEPLAPGDGP